MAEDEKFYFRPDGQPEFDDSSAEDTSKHISSEAKFEDKLHRLLMSMTAKGDFKLRPEELVIGSPVFWLSFSRETREDSNDFDKPKTPESNNGNIVEIIGDGSQVAIQNWQNRRFVVPVNELHSSNRYEIAEHELRQKKPVTIEFSKLEKKHIQ